MDAYLLDTNIVSVLYDDSRSNHQSVRRAIADFDSDDPQLISVVTIAELRFGLALSSAAGRTLDHIEACVENAEQHPLAEINRFTAGAFAQIKAAVALQRIDIHRRVPRWVEGWTDRVTGQLLQIDENDLWIAAQAIERNYVLVTSDTGFAKIISPAVPELRLLTI